MCIKVISCPVCDVINLLIKLLSNESAKLRAHVLACLRAWRDLRARVLGVIQKICVLGVLLKFVCLACFLT